MSMSAWSSRAIELMPTTPHFVWSATHDEAAAGLDQGPVGLGLEHVGQS